MGNLDTHILAKFHAEAQMAFTAHSRGHAEESQASGPKTPGITCRDILLPLHQWLLVDPGLNPDGP